MLHHRYATAAALLFVCAGCAPLPTPPPAPTSAERSARTAATPPPTTAAQLSLARAVIERANSVRAEVGARRLVEATALMNAAQEYALELARLQRLDHASPTPGRATMIERIEAAGGTWQRAAENLVATSGVSTAVPDVTIELWLTSDGHRRNLLDPGFTTTGAGVARDARGIWYVVQLYVLPPRVR